jgi:hypothetical protein
MANCPICGKEHKTLVNMSTHMILIAINHQGDDHGRYLDLLTGRDQHVWGHKNDAAVAEIFRNFYRKLKRFPTLEELEDREDSKLEKRKTHNLS